MLAAAGCSGFWPSGLCWRRAACCRSSLLQRFGHARFHLSQAGGVAGGRGVWLVLRPLFWQAAAPSRGAARIAKSLGAARRLHDACFEKAETHYQQEIKRIKDEFETHHPDG